MQKQVSKSVGDIIDREITAAANHRPVDTSCRGNGRRIIQQIFSAAGDAHAMTTVVKGRGFVTFQQEVSYVRSNNRL